MVRSTEALYHGNFDRVSFPPRVSVAAMVRGKVLGLGVAARIRRPAGERMLPCGQLGFQDERPPREFAKVRPNHLCFAPALPPINGDFDLADGAVTAERHP